MTRWLQAATTGLCQTDRTDRTDETPGKPAIVPAETATPEVLSVLSVCQFEAEPAAPSHAAAPWSGRRYLPEAIRTGVAGAFKDWQAMNNPRDTRAWR